MKKTKLTRSLLAACSIVALSAVMYGCTGDGAENDLKATQGDLEEVQAQLDAANAMIAELQGQVSGLEGDLMTAQNNAAGLQMDLDAANAMAAGLRMDLDAANAEAMRIQGLLDDEMGNSANLQTMLDDANAEAMRIQGLLDDANAETMRIQGLLDDANAETMRIQGLLDMANETITTLRAQLATESTVRGLFATAQTSTTNATSAGMAAEMAVTTATEAQVKLGVIGSAGDSAAQMMNAQAIMTAQANAAQAVMDAQAALDAANAAKTTAMALDDANPQKTAVIEALDAAIMVAEAQLKVATDNRDSDSLSDAVDAVTGGANADPQGTPASRAREVAMAIGEALGGMSTLAGLPTGTPAIVTAVGSIPADDTATVVKMNDAIGKTWAEIVGEANLMEARVGANNTNVKLGSVSGMMASAVDADVTATGGVDNGNTYADGFTSAGSTYRGIPGSIHCLGTDCEVDANGNLKGSWYFTPTSPMVDYVKQTDDETTDADESKLYEAETLFAQFGYWLTMVDHDSDAATPDRVRLNRYAATGATASTTASQYAKVDGMPDSATYRGDAIGMSVHKVLDSDGDITQIDSGRFTADAELVLRFGDGADVTLGGTIDNFQSEGANVDSSWTVELERTTFTDGDLAGTADNGKTVASGRDGEWTATAYGAAAPARPTGIFGAFNAHFTDGHAAGVYATRK